MQPPIKAPKIFALRARRRPPAFELTRAPKFEATPLVWDPQSILQKFAFCFNSGIPVKLS